MPSRSGRIPAAALAALALVGSGALALLAYLSFAAPEPAPIRSTEPTVAAVAMSTRYVGDRACRSCHPGESAAHARSGHARTLRPAAEHPLARWLDGRTVADPERPESTWTYDLEGATFRAARTEGDTTSTHELDFAFGSAHHGTTFVTLSSRNPFRPKLLEHRLSYYASGERVALTPGQSADARVPHRTPDGRGVEAAQAIKCFGCHSTWLSDRGPLSLDFATLIPNVTCERCHGPGDEHVRVAEAGGENLAMPFGDGNWDAESMMRECGACHRHPTEFDPGKLDPDNGELTRFQPVGLMQSLCYRASQGALSCLTCHDAHGRVSTEPAHYEASCLSCHGAGSSTASCPVSPREGCIGCHMPKRDSGQNILFTDHWIRVQRGNAGGDPGKPERAD